MRIVLFAPEIAPNAGNVARLCAATGTELHLIEPLGFRLDDAQLKRAGMDYWQWVQWKTWRDWQTFEQSLPSEARIWLIESDGPKTYAEVQYAAADYLVFGSEGRGLPNILMERHPKSWVRIPMMKEESRSLNLSNCAALVLYEALRQQGFPGEV